MQENSLKKILEKEVEEDMEQLNEEINDLLKLSIEELKERYDNLKVKRLHLEVLKRNRINFRRKLFIHC